MTFWVLTFIAEMLEVKGTLYFFDTFMEKRDGGYRNRYRFFVYCGVLYLVAVTGAFKKIKTEKSFKLNDYYLASKQEPERLTCSLGDIFSCLQFA